MRQPTSECAHKRVRPQASAPIYDDILMALADTREECANLQTNDRSTLQCHAPVLQGDTSKRKRPRKWNVAGQHFIWKQKGQRDDVNTSAYSTDSGL